MLNKKYPLRVALVLGALSMAGLFGCGGGGGGGSSTTSSTTTSTTASTPASTPASSLSVQINGVAATPGSNGEYSFPNGGRITVSGSSSLGSTSTSTVNATGGAATTSLNVHTMTSMLYDVNMTAQPGYLTTINFTALGVAIKLRYH